MALSIADTLVRIYNIKSVKSYKAKESRTIIEDTVSISDCSILSFICEPCFATSVLEYAEKLKTDPIYSHICSDYSCIKTSIVTNEEYYVSNKGKILDDNAELRIYEGERAVIAQHEFPTDYESDYDSIDDLIRRWNNRNKN